MEYSEYSNNLQHEHQHLTSMSSGVVQGMPTRSMMEPLPALSHNLDAVFDPPHMANYQHYIHGHDAVQPPQSLAYGAPVPESTTYDGPTSYAPFHLQDMYDAYIASYNSATTPSSLRMENAQAFAEALLSHYYPASQGYIVQRSDPSPMAKHGLNFMLKAADGTDPEYYPLAPLPPLSAWKDPKNGKNKAKPPSAKTLAQREKKRAVEEYKRQFSSWYPYTMGVQWHFIEPADIAMFEVLKQHSNGQETEFRLHTCLAILLAPHDSLPRIAETNPLHRADILADALSRSHDVQRGHAILLFGTWLEMYDFDNGTETYVAGAEDKEYYEGVVSAEDPRVELCRAPNGSGLALDLRTVGLELVDEVCGMVVGGAVVGIGGGVVKSEGAGGLVGGG